MVVRRTGGDAVPFVTVLGGDRFLCRAGHLSIPFRSYRPTGRDHCDFGVPHRARIPMDRAGFHHCLTRPAVSATKRNISGNLLAAAPAIVLGWRSGRVAPQPRRIWLSGFVGLWLPLVLSTTVASLADQAGANLFWAPSLLRGFNWAVLGFPKGLLPSVGVLLSLTILWPALLSIVSLRQIIPEWRSGARWCQITIILCTAGAAVSSALSLDRGSFGSVFTSSVHERWAESLLALGIVAGVCAMFRRSA